MARKNIRGTSEEVGCVQFVLLCDAALGKCQTLKSHGDDRFDMEKKKAFDSVHVIGDKSPDPEMDARLCCLGSAVTVPLGKLVENPQGVHSFSEYCVYNSNQVSLRYIIKLQRKK